MDTFLTVFFFLVGIIGLVFQNAAGIFAGLTLFPWQMIKLMKGKLLNLIIIIISAITGGILFLLMEEWLLLVLFLLMQLYNYWGYLNLGREEK